MSTTQMIGHTAIDFWLPILAVFVANIVLFFIAQCKKDNGIVDVMWGILFIIPNLIILCVKSNWNERTILTFCLICVWGLRLAVHIGLRHSGKEDFRYMEMRKGWEAKGKAYYYFAALTFVFIMQAFFSLIVNASALFISVWSNNQFYPLDAVGAGVWLFGFTFEMIGDWQLEQFRKNPNNRGQIIKSGLWRYTRHPNYFGEAVLWWGIFLIACSIDYGWITFFAPLFITFLIRFVSGVPLLENKYKLRPEFQEYMKETNVFFPWFVRKNFPASVQQKVPTEDQETPAVQSNK